MGILDQTPTSGRTTGVFAPSIADYLEHFQDRNNAWKSRNAPTYQQTGVTPNIVAQDEQGMSIVGDQILAPRQYRDPFKPDQGEGDGYNGNNYETELNPLTAARNLGIAGTLSGVPFGGLIGAGIGAYQGANGVDARISGLTGVNPNTSALDAFLDATTFGGFGNSLRDQVVNFGLGANSPLLPDDWDQFRNTTNNNVPGIGNWSHLGGAQTTTTPEQVNATLAAQGIPTPNATYNQGSSTGQPDTSYSYSGYDDSMDSSAGSGGGWDDGYT